MSRFKVSVVTEPDPSKLHLPEKEKEKENDLMSIIQDTYDRIMERIVASSYPVQTG